MSVLYHLSYLIIDIIILDTIVQFSCCNCIILKCNLFKIVITKWKNFECVCPQTVVCVTFALSILYPPVPETFFLLFFSLSISLVIMVFVNYGGGRYWFFRHESWNGESHLFQPYCLSPQNIKSSSWSFFSHLFCRSNCCRFSLSLVICIYI